MRAMIEAARNAPAPPSKPTWHRWLLWAGIPLCFLGIYRQELWGQWAPGRFAETLILASGSLVLAWMLRRLLHASLATLLAALWLAGLVVFTGILPVLATLTFIAAATAIGTMLVRYDRPALQCACGLAVFAGITGWLLPLPIHSRWLYLAVCSVLIIMQRGALADTWRCMKSGWTSAISAAPPAAVFAIIVLGIASTGCWLPTMQYDDLAYHLRLPWSLMESGRYLMDPELHVWALAPWASDVLHAFPQVMAGEEARGPLNAVWLSLTASGIWHLTTILGGTKRAAWISVALYSSLPLTAALAAGMQTESATAALLAWLAVVIVRSYPSGASNLHAGAVLTGGLIALKLSSAVFTILLMPLALWRNRPRALSRQHLIAVLIVVVLGGSSYFYAGMVAGNPFLPLFNGLFESPYFRPLNFQDPRWGSGFDPLLPWRLTFETGKYFEGFDGGSGFVLVAFSGAWLLSLLDRRLLATSIVITALFFLPLLPTHYVRYVHPVMALLLPLFVVTAFQADRRRGHSLIFIVCIMNLAFQANSNWMMKTGAVKETILSLGRDEPLYEHYAPERVLMRLMHSQAGESGNVMVLDASMPFAAELGERGRNVSWYSPTLETATAIANTDPSGFGWIELFKRENIEHVIARPDAISPAQRAAFERLGAYRRAQVGQAAWWKLPAPAKMTTP